MESREKQRPESSYSKNLVKQVREAIVELYESCIECIKHDRPTHHINPIADANTQGWLNFYAGPFRRFEEAIDLAFKARSAEEGKRAQG